MVPLLNITRDPGKTAKFVCHVHNLQPNNTKVNFLWKINEVELEGGNNRQKMKVFKVSNERCNMSTQWRNLSNFRRKTIVGDLF